jgi:16S rRNA U516 pseudouridylate synthase RsuA-like enzyme
MFLKHGITVLELDRIAMGNLLLDKNLKLGESRYITKEEIKLIKTKK